MAGLTIAFLLGFAFGGAVFAVLRHEMDLSGHAGVLGVLFLVGLLLVTTLAVWFRRVSKNLPQAKGSCSMEREWLGFLWASPLLLIGYLTLAVVVAFL